MDALSKRVVNESNFPNLHELDKKDIRKEILTLLVDGEEVIASYNTIRDQVIFTNKRIITANIQAVTGTKKSFYSYPYSKIQYYGVETAGVLDIDSELILDFADGVRLSFDFTYKVNIEKICSTISSFIL